jgi:hypothetical protein
MAHAALSALVAGYSRQKRTEKLLAIFQAYIDDSVRRYADRRLYLAGYVNSVDKWLEFSDAWEAALSESPAIKYFHMVEANGCRGQFRGWGKLDVQLKLDKLARVIRQFDPWSFDFSVSTKAYEDSFKGRAPYGFQIPYSVAFIGSIVTVAQFHIQLGSSVPIDFIFDEQASVHRTASAVYDHLKSIQQPEVRDVLGSTPIFRSDKDILPLQAADMLVWHIQREVRDGTLVPRRPQTNDLVASGRHVSRFLDDDTVKRIGDEIAGFPGVSNIANKKRWKDVLDLIESGTLDITRIRSGS